MSLTIIDNNPNAAVAAITSPIAAGAVWLVSTTGHFTLSPESSAAVGSISVAAVLFFFQGILRSSKAVWEYGIRGCCRRIWAGKSA